MRGFAACHPLSVEVLKATGVTSGSVTQGWGDAKASAGYHKSVGLCGGKKYSTCFDLAYDLATPLLIEQLGMAGIAAFVRNWPGNQHIHCVQAALLDDNKRPLILDGPRSQLLDWMHSPDALDGLVGHRRLSNSVPIACCPTPYLQAHLRHIYSAWLPDYPTKVLSPEGQQIVCYAWLGDGTVTADMVKFLTWWGCSVLTSKGGEPHQFFSAALNGKKIDLSRCNPVFDGRRWRGQVRGMAEALSLGVSFEWATGHYSCKVKLVYA